MATRFIDKEVGVDTSTAIANDTTGTRKVKDLPDATGFVYDKVDNTFKFNAAGTIKTLADTSSTQTFTNKTLTAPTLTAPIITGAGSIAAGTTIASAINSDVKVLAASAAYTSNVTAATLTGFSWTVVAGGTYIFEVNLPATMTTNGGLTVNFKLTTATLTSIQYDTYAATASDNTTGVSTQGTTTTDATKVFDSATAAYTIVRIRGSMVVNAGGTFAWQACQNSSHANTTTVLLGSYAKLIRTL